MEESPAAVAANSVTPVPATEAPAVDPLVELQRLRDANRRWQRVGLLVGVGFMLLFVLSLVQFLGTIIACKLLTDARREAALVNRETANYVRQIRDHRAQQAHANATQRAPSAPAPDGDAPSARVLEVVVASERLKEELARTEKALVEAEGRAMLNKEEPEVERLKTEMRRLQALLEMLEQRRQAELEDRKTERVRIEREIRREIRNESLPPGHEEDKHCPFPLRQKLTEQ